MKKIDFKSMFIGAITGSLLFSGIVGASTLITDNIYLNSYAVTVDGKAYTPSNPLLNYAGTTYVPLREFGTMTGSTVSFANKTISIKKPTTTSTNSSSNTSTNTGTSTKPSTSALNGKKITLDATKSDSFYVDLNAYSSKSASVAVTSGTAYASVSKSSLTSSSLITVTGKKEGSAIITVTYNNGYKDYVYITVNGNKDIEIVSGKSDYIKVDLEDHDADKATLSISSGSSYITLGKTEVTKSTDVKVTGKKAGEATVKVKYDSGDTEYYNIIVTKSSSASDEEISVEIDSDNGKFVYYVDLDEYDAKTAELYITDKDDCISTSKTKFTRSGALTITGVDDGKAEVEIEFYDEDDDYIDSFIINLDILKTKDFDFDDYDYEDDFEIEYNDYKELTIDPDYYDADWATLSIITGTDYISLNKTSITKEADIEIDGDDDGEAIIQVTYSTGDIEYYYVEVVD